MGFASVVEYNQAVADGKTWASMWRRTAPAMVLNGFTDMSYGGGGPAANYYASAPLVPAVLAPTDGIYAGPSVAPATKHLRRIWMSSGSTNSASRFTLLDYIQYVPFLDGDSDALQEFTTIPMTHASINRYTTGAGVQLMLVGQGPGTANGYFAITYVNQDGNERTTEYTSGASANFGLFSNPAGQVLQGLRGISGGDGGGPFVRLRPGDTGVRAVRGVQLLVPCGGIFALVMVKPVCDIHTKDNSLTPFEMDFFAENGKLPVVGDGAYLNFIGQPTAAGTPNHVAELEFIWN
jgi:hypothetical protein